jgi:hypothetical protein
MRPISRTRWIPGSLPRVPAIIVVALLACGDGATDPADSLVGNWDLIGFMDGGVTATVNGTMTFGSDGRYTMQGSITFPNEPTDVVNVQGTFAQAGGVATLMSSGESSSWDLVFSGDRVVLTEREPPPANSMTLRRT